MDIRRNDSIPESSDEERETSSNGIHAQNTINEKDLFAGRNTSDHDSDLVLNEDEGGVSDIPLENDSASGMRNRAKKSNLFLKKDTPVEPDDDIFQSDLTAQDIDTIQTLDKEYDLSLMEREIGWNARNISVRQNAGITSWLMCIFILIGTITFQLTTDWSLTDSILFCIYTITTVGYGNNEHPNHPVLLIFISLYIFVGIANLTIMVAQIYQWIVLETTRMQYEKDKQEFKKRLENVTQISEDLEHTMNGEAPVKMSPGPGAKKSWRNSVPEKIANFYQILQKYIYNNPFGQLVAVMIPYSLMILLGALVVGSIEGWGPAQSLYFAVVSMTTVGFGDLVPSNLASQWFCIFWLPFSVGFLSLYLRSVAQYYIHLSSQTVERIEHKIRLRLYSHRATQEREREEAIERMASGGFGGVEIEDGVITVGSEFMRQTPAHIINPARKNFFAGFATVSTRDQNEPEPDFAVAETIDRNRRRNEVRNNSGFADESATSMKTMKDVIAAVKLNMVTDRRSPQAQSEKENAEQLSPSAYPGRKGRPSSSPTKDKLSLQSTMHYTTAGEIEKKPPFALRVLVQERLAAIIAYEIAGYQSHLAIERNTLTVVIDSLKYTTEKWMIPRRATKSFRSVALEALYYVGERDLILFGPDALFKLKPVELQRLFGPLLAALGDADTMEMWLYSTNHLVYTEFIKEDHKDEIEGEAVMGETGEDQNTVFTPPIRYMIDDGDTPRDITFV